VTLLLGRRVLLVASAFTFFAGAVVAGVFHRGWYAEIAALVAAVGWLGMLLQIKTLWRIWRGIFLRARE
jgi:hypothetical protein